ncbi:MAG: DUF2961 domain-containing protein [Carboxylicivirga sp.]|jgi:hypothetical protein|nr:DUF2961 domain-containing protein [Carboxylicivirga sp.]
MKTNFPILIIAFLFLTGCKTSDEINLSTLLNEMVDRDQITYFPETNYRCLQASSYNRESVSLDQPGWFADSDGIGFIRIEEKNGQNEWVIMEDEGPGVITKIWAVCFYYGLNDTIGANIKIYLDGASEPVINTNFFALVKGQDFIKPPFADESTRAGNLYFPIPYGKSCKITMDKKAFYNIVNYRSYPQGSKVRTFTMEEFNSAQKVREDVAQQLLTATNNSENQKEVVAELSKGEELRVDLPNGAKAVRHLEVKLEGVADLPQALRSIVLSGTFDGNETVWTPLGDFFNNVGKIQAFKMWEREVQEDGTLICRWVMPYENSGLIQLKNLYDDTYKVRLKVRTSDYKWNDNSMHFYASWRMDTPTPTFPLFDWNFLEAQGRGVVVGDQWTVLNPREGWWGEGDEKIYVDDDFERNFPSHFGTGTEDYYGWAGGVVPTPADQFSKPFLGNVIVANPRSMGYNVCSRTRVLDAIPFNERIRFDVESSCGTRQRWHYLQYSQTTFWYGAPGVQHNRQALPEMASRKLPTLEGLQAKVEAAKKEQYIVDGALEAEILAITDKSEGVKEKHAVIPVWGEISSGQLKNIWFEKKGDYATMKITEQFEASDLKICAAVGPMCGAFDIYVNGEKRASQDLYSNHGGMTNPYIDLGKCQPKDNAFVLKFVFKGANTKAHAKQKKYALGIDFFLIENNFLKR